MKKHTAVGSRPAGGLLASGLLASGLLASGLLAAVLLTSCSDDPAVHRDPGPIASEESPVELDPIAREAADLTSSAWQVTTIRETNVIDETTVTLTIGAQGELAGSTGCNRFFGQADLTADTFRASGIGSTRRACQQPVMDQETEFLQALEASSTYRAASASELELIDADGRVHLVLTRVPADPTVADLPAPSAATP